MKLAGTLSLLFAGVALMGCGKTHNHFAADSPADMHPNASPTSERILAEQGTSEQRARGWDSVSIEPVTSDVIHGPLYFENPLVDKGASYDNRLGWEDFLAPPYDIARMTLNWMASPVSMIVTPPWQPMASDGEISEQLLGPDHDAELSDGVEPEFDPEHNFSTIEESPEPA